MFLSIRYPKFSMEEKKRLVLLRRQQSESEKWLTSWGIFQTKWPAVCERKTPIQLVFTLIKLPIMYGLKPCMLFFRSFPIAACSRWLCWPKLATKSAARHLFVTELKDLFFAVQCRRWMLIFSIVYMRIKSRRSLQDVFFMTAICMMFSGRYRLSMLIMKRVLNCRSTIWSSRVESVSHLSPGLPMTRTCISGKRHTWIWLKSSMSLLSASLAKTRLIWSMGICP